MASASCSTGAHATLEREPKMDTAELSTKCAGHQGLILWLQAVRKLHCSLLQIDYVYHGSLPLGSKQDHSGPTLAPLKRHQQQ